ncbi:hypothetical protein PUN28_000280 [Cardiocondyla obscurior]|uniref:Ribosomal protein S14 n=1 Tax=Cardiocondyla obscurior TaxID=286306 RepID=A0AAW2GZ37_9HYME
MKDKPRSRVSCSQDSLPAQFRPARQPATQTDRIYAVSLKERRIYNICIYIWNFYRPRKSSDPSLAVLDTAERRRHAKKTRISRVHRGTPCALVCTADVLGVYKVGP